MDGGIALTVPQIKGRNTWILWSGRDDRLWDYLANYSLGQLDLLKILSSNPGLKFNRDNRWNYLGLLNEPCFIKATAPDPRRFGLWLDKRRADCPPDPFEDETKYPGLNIGARGRSVASGSYYGYASGVVGLRLFPNPDFDEEASKNWDPYYMDPSYYTSSSLVRPHPQKITPIYEVGPALSAAKRWAASSVCRPSGNGLSLTCGLPRAPATIQAGGGFDLFGANDWARLSQPQRPFRARLPA